MFDSRTTQLASSYQQFVENSLLNFRRIGKAIEELLKAIQEKVKEKKEELSAVDVQVGSEKYRLVPDEKCPGAWKWESAQMSDFQEQTVLRRLVTESAVNPEVQADIRDVERDSSLAVVAHTESGESIVVYHQDSKGSCHTNIVTTNLEEEEIINAVNEVHYPLSETTVGDESRRPADVVEEKGDRVNIEGSAVEPKTSLLDEIVSPKEDYALQNSGSPLPQSPSWEEEAVVFWDEDAPMPEPPIEDYPPDQGEEAFGFLDKDALMPKPSRLGEKTVGSANQDAPMLPQEEELSDLGEGIDKTEPRLQNSPAFDIPTPTPAVSPQRINTQSAETETENTPPRKRSLQESQFNVPTETDATDAEIPTKPRQKPAAEYSYGQIASSDEVSPETKRWVRVVEVPISKAVANSRAERARIKGENIKIAHTAVEMLKAYGEETGYGYKVYKSDAFVIKLEGSKYSIHHRRDELNYFGNPILQFSLNSKGNPKIEIPPTQMLPVERQEFLMVGERLESGKKLPQLAIADLRDIANNLGSLAPAGTFKTLESFRETEMLGLLNSALQKANTDTLTVGEYTLTRTRDVEAGRANLSLHKTAQGGERRELLSFTLQKTDAGLIKQVDKLNISDWDLTQLKFISQNAKAFDLRNTLGNSKGQQQLEESVSEIKVELHPAIRKAWNQLETQGDSKWHSSIRQENERIKQNLQEFGGKLTIGSQRELYFQILAQQQLNSSTEQFKMPQLKEIMKDLKQWRQEDISNRYTPSEQIPFAPEKTAARTTAATKSKSELSL